MIPRSASLAATSGLLLALAFPRVELSWLAWVGLVPLFRAVEGRPPARAFRVGWICGFVLFAVTLYWITHAVDTYSPIPPVGSALLLALLSGVLGLQVAGFAAAVAFASRHGIAPALFAPVAWVALEWVRGSLPVLALPWANLGYSLNGNLAVIQNAEWCGVYGLSALLVFCNAVLYAVGLSRGSRRARGLQLALLTLLLVVVHVFGAWRLWGLGARPADRHLRVALVQGNIPQERKWDLDYQEATIATYERLTQAAAARGVELIVWPETAAPFFFQLHGPFAERIEELARKVGAPILFGSPGFVQESGGEPRLRNRAYLVSASGETVGRYDKQVLVPFGEFVPLHEFLFFLDKIVEGSGMFTPGDSAAPLPIGPEAAGVLICYEAIFPYLARRSVKEGATLLVNITNDAWFGDTSAPRQHLAMAALRAVENRVPVVRVANTGISAIVQPDGRVTHATPLFEATYRVADLEWRRVDTFYSRHGDVFAYACLGLCCVLLATAMRRRRSSS